VIFAREGPRKFMRRLPTTLMLMGLLGSLAAGCVRASRNPASLFAVVPVANETHPSVPSERTEIEFVDLEVDTQTAGNEGFRGSYPIIHHPNPAVTAALAEVVGGGAVMENTCGFEDCSVVSANTGLVSLLRSGMAEPCVDPERDALAAQGMGGAPAGPRVRAWILRIDGTTVTEVSFDEVMASPDKASAALKRYCEKELAAPDPDVARHEGYCFSCDGIDRIGRERGEWSFGVTADALHFYRSESSCDLIVPYPDVAPWLASDSPVFRVLRAPDKAEE